MVDGSSRRAVARAIHGSASTSRATSSRSTANRFCPSATPARAASDSALTCAVGDERTFCTAKCLECVKNQVPPAATPPNAKASPANTSARLPRGGRTSFFTAGTPGVLGGRTRRLPRRPKSHPRFRRGRALGSIPLQLLCSLRLERETLGVQFCGVENFFAKRGVVHPTMCSDLGKKGVVGHSR